ncbi:hypothetical protein RF679_06785 [Undibacterium cyanobacteriorum]|uniref:Uncharacterized protein n=1 Tax=Undibacterium cyanobacteriorum TaxID=3073561 RepID=A0ABY9RPS2_9BURK|nr:hypothetical protein [Undibacterium sp. 20NA77.5]WMW81986.1 hypothetical protein RF679_06785 [Undibacterium sp. 20NA77.5]
MFLRRFISPLVIAFTASIAFAGTAMAQSPYQYSNAHPIVSHAPAMYNYVYYPSAQVYFAPSNRVWFWFDGYRWQNAYALPYGMQIDFRLGGIPITLRSALPYREHHYVDSYYGRPWRARHYHDRGRHERERHEWRERENWREQGRGYPRHDYDRDDRYQERHHRW